MTGDQARAALDQALRKQMAASVMWQHADEQAASARGGMRAEARLRLGAATRAKERASGAVLAAMNDANSAGITDAEIVTMVSDLYGLEADDASLASAGRATTAQAAGSRRASTGPAGEL